MALGQHRPEQGFSSEPRPDAVGKQRDIFARRGGFSGEVGLHRFERRGGESRKAHDIETKAGVDPRIERGKPFMEKLADAIRLAQGQRCADRDAADRAIHPEQKQLERPRAFAAPFEILPEAPRQQEHQPLDILDEPDRLCEMPFHRKGGHGQARRYDFLDLAQRLVEPEQEDCAEPAGERGTRGAAHRADRPQADALQAGSRIGVEPQCRKRKRAEKIRLFAAFQNSLSGRKPGRRPGGSRRGGKARPHVETLVEEA